MDCRAGLCSRLYHLGFNLFSHSPWSERAAAIIIMRISFFISRYFIIWMVFMAGRKISRAKFYPDQFLMRHFNVVRWCGFSKLGRAVYIKQPGGCYCNSFAFLVCYIRQEEMVILFLQ